MFLFFIGFLNFSVLTTNIGANVFLIILYTLICLLFIFFFYIRIRFDNCASFIHETMQLCREYDKRRIAEMYPNILWDSSESGVYLFFDKLPFPNKMVFSFKPFKLESFLSPELIEKLKL